MACLGPSHSKHMCFTYQVKKRTGERSGEGQAWEAEAELPLLDMDTAEEGKMEVNAQLTHCLVLVLFVICFTTWQ